MKRSTFPRLGFSIISTLSIGAASLASAAVTMPYVDNFDSTMLGQPANNFTTSGSSTSLIVDEGGGDHAYQVHLLNSANTEQAFSLLDVSSLGGMQDFSITSTVSIAYDSVGSSIGFSFLGSSISSPSSYYLADMNTNTGEIRIVRIGGSLTSSSSDTTTFSGFSSGTEYTMTVTGTYSGSTLNLSYSVTDGTNTAAASASDITPLGGTYVGYRTRKNSSTELAVNYDNLAIIPEPGTYALLSGLLCLSYIMIRRRKR